MVTSKRLPGDIVTFLDNAIIVLAKKREIVEISTLDPIRPAFTTKTMLFVLGAEAADWEDERWST